MNPGEAKNLFDNIVGSYFPADKRVMPIESRAWIGMLKKLKFDQALKAFEALMIESPPGDCFGNLPKPKIFKLIYEEIGKPVYRDIIKNCPCCDSTRFVILQYFKYIPGQGNVEGDYAFDCSCWIKSGRTRRTNSFEACGLNKCDNKLCFNPKGLTRIETSQGMGDYLKSFLRHCKHKPVVNERYPA